MGELTILVLVAGGGAIFRVRSAASMKARKYCGYEKRQSSIDIKTPADRITSW
jgi:hypothetical protein